MEFDDRIYEKVTNRTNRLFYKYQQEYQLSYGEATGKVLYEMENTFDRDPLSELYAYAELCKINESHADVLQYLKNRLAAWFSNYFPQSAFETKISTRSTNTIGLHELSKKIAIAGTVVRY